MTKLKRAVIKEELVALTGKYQLAVVLNQMIYWSERCADKDKYIAEELERYKIYGENNKASEEKIEALEGLAGHGWIYKKAEELSEETMLNVTPKAMRAYIAELVSCGWINERRNPKIKMDRTLQYRVDIQKIQYDLQMLGYALEGYKLFELNTYATGENVNTNLPEENTILPKVNRTGEKVSSTGVLVNRTGENVKAIPEITTETSIEITTDKKKVRKKGETKVETYNSIIDERITDENVKNGLIEFIKMRKLIKAAITDQGLKAIITELLKISTDPLMQRAVLDQSIAKSYRGVFPLSSSTYGQAKKASGDNNPWGHIEQPDLPF